MTDPIRSIRLRELFDEGRALPREQLERFCRTQCGDDVDLRAELEELLAVSAEQRESLLDSPLLAHAIVEPAAGGSGVVSQLAKVGPFRLREVIGEGGMGTVYRAEQCEPVQREVAVKLIAAGMSSRRIVARFDAERQALARMHHPGIAEIYEAGTAPDGRPWFAMELVLGEPLTKWCDHRRLSVRERVALFREVCSAVQHAHHKGVIHRDLKPSNILVTELDGEARPKIIDFGIARATEPGGPGSSALTREHEVVGTPSYMSPEQLQLGRDVDSRTDVYSLGVMLYELLSGDLPFHAEVESHRRVGTAAEPPSERLRRSTTLGELADSRAMDVRALRRSLRGDLDWITLRALEPEPERRYATAAELGAELNRYLDHEPVVAGPPSLSYRLRKTIRRHRVVLSAVASVFALLITGVIVTADFAMDAEAARKTALARRHALHDTLWRAQARESFYGGPEPNRRFHINLRRDILEAASPGYGARHVEIVRGWVGTLPQYIQGLRDLAEHVGAVEHNGDPVVRSAIASLLFNLGRRAMVVGRSDDAEGYLGGALSLSEDRDPLDPILVRLRYSWLRSLLEQGADRAPQVEAAASRWIEEGRSAFLPRHSVLLAAYRSQRGAAHLRMGQLEAAEPDVTEAVATFAEVADGSEYHRGGLVAAIRLSDALGQSQAAEAYRAVLADRIATGWNGTDTQCSAVLLPEYQTIWQALLALREQVNDPRRDLAADAAVFVHAVEASGVEGVPARNALGFPLLLVANSAANLRDPATQTSRWGHSAVRDLFELAVRLLAPGTPDTPSLGYDEALCLLGMTLVAVGEFDETEKLAKGLLARRRAPGTQGQFQHWIAHRHLAECEDHDGRFEMADRRLLRAIEGLIAELGVDNRNVTHSLQLSFRMWQRRDALDQGVESLRAAGLLRFAAVRRRIAQMSRRIGRSDLAARVLGEPDDAAGAR